MIGVPRGWVRSLVSVWSIVGLTLRGIDGWTDLPLSAFFLNRHCGIDQPVEALPFFVAFAESLVLAEVVPHTRLPAIGTNFELVEGVFLLDVAVDLLQVHLTSRR
jgi:hypothetical protein